jgi:hypothetical protein
VLESTAPEAPVLRIRTVAVSRVAKKYQTFVAALHPQAAASSPAASGRTPARVEAFRVAHRADRPSGRAPPSR